MNHSTKSSARILRDVKRMTKFLESKRVLPMKLEIVHQENISIPSEPKLLSIQKCASVNIPPDNPMARLVHTSLYCIDIPPAPLVQPAIPRPYLHPYIVEASKMLYGRSPWELTPEQAEHFEGYQEYKTRNGRPIEEDICYKPSDPF